MPGAPGRQTEGRPLVVVPGEPPGEDPGVPVPEGDVPRVVLRVSLHSPLGQDVRVLGIPGQARPGRVADLFVMFPANRQQTL